VSEVLAPLAQKLESKEALSFADFEGLIKAYKDAMADGRISIREGIRLAFAVMAILSEFTDKPTGETTFGF
jgi:hypothetical protein